MTEDRQTPGSAGLDHVRKAFEAFGREDPLYAALTRGGREGGRWDAHEFFEIGRREIQRVLAYVDSRGLALPLQRALDFGCGAGRLTQALAEHFAEVVGIDIASAMVERAREHNRHSARVDYRVNTTSDLGQLASESFDLVYSYKVLQHIPPEHQARYIGEFLRVLRPGGLAIFQLRNGPRVEPGSVRALVYTLNRTYFRRFSQRLRGRVPYEMHYLARSRVEEVIAQAGGRIEDVVDLSRGRPNKSLRYCVIKL